MRIRIQSVQVKIRSETKKATTFYQPCLIETVLKRTVLVKCFVFVVMANVVILLVKMMMLVMMMLLLILVIKMITEQS
jgi:Flp pilus assembly protein TadB